MSQPLQQPLPQSQEAKLLLPHSPQAPTTQELGRKLAALFPVDVISWKVQTVKGNRCLAVAYIDARDVMNRLDEVIGWDCWEDEYTDLPGGSVMCKLRVRVNGEWITKVDVGSQSAQPDAGDKVKAAFSDGLKRAAVKFGVGRYLYSLPMSWVDYDPQKKQMANEPKLPAWATPAAVPTGMQKGSDLEAKISRWANAIASAATLEQLQKTWEAVIADHCGKNHTLAQAKDKRKAILTNVGNHPVQG